MNFKLNPTIEEYGTDKTLLHLAWSVWWRAVVAFWGIVIIAYAVVGFWEGLAA